MTLGCAWALSCACAQNQPVAVPPEPPPSEPFVTSEDEPSEPSEANTPKPDAAAPASAAAARPSRRQLRAKEQILRAYNGLPEPKPLGLTLIVVPSPAPRPWSLGIVNSSSKPYAVAADPRFLRFSVEVSGKKKPVECALPAGLSPEQTPEELLVKLDPQQALVDAFNPDIYCYESGSHSILAAGSVLHPSFGFEPKTKTRWRKGRRERELVSPQPPPFVAGAFEPATDAPATFIPEGAGIKQLTAEPLTLGPQYSRGFTRPPPAAEASGEQDSEAASEPAAPPPPLRLELKRGSDAANVGGSTVVVSLTNVTREPVRVYFRREFVRLTLRGPTGIVQCGTDALGRSPDRQAFRRLSPGKTLSVAIRLAELCPEGALATSGVYNAYAQFNALHTGAEYGLNAFVGSVEAENSVKLRIRRGEQRTEPPPMLHVSLKP